MDAVGWEQRPERSCLIMGVEVRAGRGAGARAGLWHESWRKPMWKSFQRDWVSHRLQDAVKDQGCQVD